MGVAAGAVVWMPLLRAERRSAKRLKISLTELKRMQESVAAGTLDPAGYAAKRASVAESILASMESEPPSRVAARYVTIAVAILIPLSAVGIYRWIAGPPPTEVARGMADLGGESAAAPGESSTSAETASVPPADHGVDMQSAIARLAEKLRAHPEDAEGWALLGRTYRAMQQYAQARDAFRHAVTAAPTDAGYRRELAMTPTAPLTENDSQMDGGALEEAPPPAATAPAVIASTASQGLQPPASKGEMATRITVEVVLDSKLKDRVAPSDTLFVFAKAAHGPPMPLAIVRLSAGQLPATVMLNDAMAMMPDLTLSRYPQIVLGARISKSGNAIAQTGDLEAASIHASNDVRSPVRLIIDRTVD